MTTVLAAVGGVLLFLLKVLGILLLVVLALMVLLLLIILFCADVSWEQDTLTVKAGALGITFPVFQYPKPEPTEESKRKKKKPKKGKSGKEACQGEKSPQSRAKGKADSEHPVHHPARSRDADPGCIRRAAHHPHPGMPWRARGRTLLQRPAITASCRHGYTRCWVCLTASFTCSLTNCASCRTLAALNSP